MKRISVYNELYNLRFGSYIPEQRTLGLRDLMAYPSDITHEYETIFKLPAKTMPAKHSHMINTNTRKSWPLLLIHNSGKMNYYRNVFANFLNEFEQVNVSSLTCQSVFDISAQSQFWFEAFQARTEIDFLGTDGIDTWVTDSLIKNKLGHSIQQSIYDYDYAFEIVEPLRKNWNLPMNEMMAIYAVMFHLSEIVRYQPDALNGVLSDKTTDGWIIKSFIESTPLTFLIRMVSWITGNDYILRNR